MRDYAEETKKRVAFIRERLEESGCRGIVFGNSGGKDSALVGILCKMACDDTLGVLLPCATAQNYGSDTDDALLLAARFGIASRTVDLTEARNAVIRAVEAAGYGASLKGAAKADASGGAPSWADAEALKDHETPRLKKRLLFSVPILLTLMYFSMGHGMWGWPAPAAFGNHVFLGLFELLLAVCVMIINGKFFTSGFSSLIRRAPNMDTLVALGSGASFVYSLAELFLMILAQGEGDHGTVMKYGMNLYFESAAMIPTLITIGKMLEAM